MPDAATRCNHVAVASKKAAQLCRRAAVKSAAIWQPKQPPTTSLVTCWHVTLPSVGQDEARPGGARRDLMVGAPRDNALAMPATALPKAHVICEPSGDRHQIRPVAWIKPPQLLVGPMTLDAPHRRRRIFLDLSACRQVAIHIWRRFDPPLPNYDCQVEAAKTRAFREQDQARERWKSERCRPPRCARTPPTVVYAAHVSEASV